MNVKDILQKIFLIILGTLVGGVLCYNILKLWEFLRPFPRKIIPSDYTQLQAQLDYNPRSIFEFHADLSFRLKSNFIGIRYSTKDSPHYTNSDEQLSRLGRPFRLSAEMEHVGGLNGITKAKRSLQIWNIKREFTNNSMTLPLSNQNNTILHAWIEEAWEDYFDEMRQILASPSFIDLVQHQKLIMISIPTLQQIESSLLGADKQIVFFPQDQLKALCFELQIPFIDTSSAFLTNELAPNWTIKDRFLDGLHLSEVGHYAVSEYLWSQLQEDF